MFNDQLTAINGGYKPAWKFNGSLMDINGEQEQTEAFDRFVERIYHGKRFSVNYYTFVSVNCIIFAPDLLGTPAHRCGVYLRD